MSFNKQSPKKGYCGHGHECLPNAKQITALQKWAPEQNRTIWPFFTWPTCLLQNEGSCAHGFAWPKNNVPYKRTPGFYKIQQFYKNTAHLQKHVHKAGLGMQFSYWNAVRKGPQAQPFGSGNFDVHYIYMYNRNIISMVENIKLSWNHQRVFGWKNVGLCEGYTPQSWQFK